VIALAEFLHADILLIDEREGIRLAKQKGLRVTGTLGSLDLASDRGMIVFAEAIRELERTSFGRPMSLLEDLVAKYKGRQAAKPGRPDRAQPVYNSDRISKLSGCL
jgi:predicted nucleic acid-binding protein